MVYSLSRFNHCIDPECQIYRSMLGRIDPGALMFLPLH